MIAKRKSKPRGKRLTGAKPRAVASTRERNREIYRLWVVEGTTQKKLATRFKLSPTQISVICRKVDREITEELAADIAPHKGRTLARYEHLYAEAMRAWHGSKKSFRDTGFLNQANKALGGIERILGLKAPDEVDIRGEVGVANEHYHEHQHQHVHIELTEEERTAHLKAIASEIEHGIVDADGATEPAERRGDSAPEPDPDQAANGP